MRLPRAFDSLRNYNFRLFWFGQLISLTGTWMQSVGQAWLVLELTGSPIALGTVTTLQFLPVLLLTLFAGVYVDRVPKHRLLLVTQTVAMLQALALAVLVSTGAIQIWHVYVLATILGLVNALDTPTRQAFVIEMVGREQIVNAVALNSVLFNSARIFGPAIGGLLIASIGLAECFYVNAASFLAVIASLLLMRAGLLRLPGPRRRGRILTEISEGLGYATRTPAILLVIIVMGVIGAFGYNFNTFVPLLARNVLGVGPDGLGTLLSAMGVGSLCASLLVASLQSTSVRRLFVGASTFVLVMAGLALSHVFPLSLALMVPLGFSSIIFNTTVNSMLQLEVPDSLRGRIMSIYTFLFMGTTPIGALTTGLLADRFGIQWALGIEALICASGILTALAYRAKAVSGAGHPGSQ